MNTYFFSSIENNCGKECFFQFCPEKYLCTLREIPALSHLRLLPNGSLFQPTLDSPLRNGDLLILHAENKEDVEKIVEHRKTVEQFRIILIIGKKAFQECRSYHLLNPRFIMTSEQNVADLKEVVGKITSLLPVITKNTNTSNYTSLQHSTR